MTPAEIRAKMFDSDPALAWIIVVQRDNLENPDMPGVTEVYGPFTKAEVDAEADSDVTPTLYPADGGKTNCVEWEVYPLIFPNWLDEPIPSTPGSPFGLMPMGKTKES